MTTYKVETKQSHTGAWEAALTIKPEYRMTVAKVWALRWGCLPVRKEIGVIGNLREAEELAYQKAVGTARALYRHAPARVSKITELAGAKSTDVAWQNKHAVEYPEHGLVIRGVLAGWHWLRERD